MGLSEITVRRQYHIIILMLCVLCIYVTLFGKLWGDIDHYWENINNVVIDLKMPYSEASFEYPPLALVIFLIPRIFSWDLDSFRICFITYSSLACVLCFHYSYKIAKKMKIAPVYVFIVYVLLILSMQQFIVARYDIFPALMILVAIDKYLDGKHGIAFVIIALATMVKLYPALVAIAFLYPFLAKRDFKSILKYIGVCALICVLVELPFILYDASSAFNWVTYHSDRGIQVESVIGTFLELIAYVSPDSIYVVNNYGSDNIAGAIPDAIAPYMNLVLALALAGFIVFLAYAALKNPYDDNMTSVHVTSIAILFILIFIIFNKVFSAQYTVWYLAMAAFVINAGSKEKNRPMVYCIEANAALCFISAAIYNFTDGYNLTFVPPFELLKNLSLIVLFVMIILYYLRCTKCSRHEGIVC